MVSKSGQFQKHHTIIRLCSCYGVGVTYHGARFVQNPDSWYGYKPTLFCTTISLRVLVILNLKPMKKYLLLLFLCTSVYSQTISEKWNSLYSRYDYTDSSGNLVGYKGYNSLTESWEYTNTNTPDPRVSQYNEPQSPIDFQILERALAANQARYEKNQAIRQARYNEGYKKVKSTVDYYRYKIGDTESVLSHRFENEVVKQINDKNYDYSRIDTEPIIRWISDNYKYILKTEIIKDLTPSKGTAIDTAPLMKYYGGYKVSMIREFTNKNGEYIVTNVDTDSENYFYLSKEALYFKKSTTKWQIRELTLKRYDQDFKHYVYDTPYGNVFIDEDFKLVTLLDVVNGKLLRKYVYNIGKYDSQVFPQK